MNENQPNLVNENVLLEQGARNNKKIAAYASFALGILLLIGILFWSLKAAGSTEEQDQSEIEEKQSTNLSDSVKKNKDFTLSNENSQNLFDLINNTPQSQKENTPQSLPSSKESTFQAQIDNAQEVTIKPRIIKGMGVAVVVNNKGIENSSNSGRDLSLVGKPDTVLEFGQNGRLTLEQATAQAHKLAGMADGSGSSSSTSQTGEVYQATAAKFSDFNPSLLLPKGTYISCSLQTRLVSELKGGISCVVSNDVYSANGHTLLIEKGSMITGTYSSGELNDGSTRLFVIWQEIRTPNNINIPVYSGATDTLGASGIEGYVNHHYMKRFGAAILLSVIDDSLSILANELSNNGNNNTNYYNYTENTRDQASEIANTALKEMIGIKPTLYKNQGDLVGVYVNKDIDFSKVYQLKRKR